MKTLVTTEMVRRIADYYGVETHGNLQVGFKWIGKEIDDAGPELFVFGCEESHGYLVGTHVRDKDAAVAAMLLAELAANCKAAGKTLHEQLDSLYLAIRLPCRKPILAHHARRGRDAGYAKADGSIAI